MEIKDAKFLISQSDPSKCPKPDKPEYAFIGRSNVGKSSLINMLTRKKGLAKTSATPGKTQLINHFIVDNAWYLVDLPGYGYAKASKRSRESWGKMIRNYILNRKNLLTLFILIDCRLEPQAIDLSFVNWAGGRQIPIALVFTKSDKLSRQQLVYSVELFKKELRKNWEELPLMFITSAEKHSGRADILDYIQQVNSEFLPPKKSGG